MSKNRLTITNSGSKYLILSLMLIAVMYLIYASIPAHIGVIDFRAYWSASHLLANSENFSDAGALRLTQRELTGFSAPFAMKTWNPPWVLVWLIPFALFDFAISARLWLITNIILLLLGTIAVWRTATIQLKDAANYWPALISAITFPSALVALLYGQVNILVFAGMAGYLILYPRHNDWAAGIAIAFCTAKPHLVYLVLPLIFFHAVVQRRWKFVAAFFIVIAASMAVVFILRPTFLQEYLQSTRGGDLFKWENATTTTFLALQAGWPALRLSGLLFLPVLLAGWYRYRSQISYDWLIGLSVALSVATMPFGWSYDFVVLLLPIIQMLAWVRGAASTWWVQLALVIALTGIYAAYYWQRIMTPSELWFFWLPLVVIALFLGFTLKFRTTGSHQVTM